MDSPAFRELAGLPSDDRDAARQLLSQAMVELGYTEPPSDKPAWQRIRQLLDPAAVAVLEDTLAVVQRDVDATAPDAGPLRLLPRWDGSVVVTLPNGDYDGSSSGHTKCWSWTWPVTLAGMAGFVQNLLMEVLWLAWPSCPEHDRVLRPDDRQLGQGVWFCEHGAHVVSAVGELGRPRTETDGIQRLSAEERGNVTEAHRQLLVQLWSFNGPPTWAAGALRACLDHLCISTTTEATEIRVHDAWAEGPANMLLAPWGVFAPCALALREYRAGSRMSRARPFGSA